MRNILQMLLMIVSLVLLVACGGSGSATKPVDTNESKTVSIEIDRDCIANHTVEAISTYITLKSGDTIVRDETNTKIEMYQGDDDTKAVCIVNGSAHIVREVGE